MITGLRIFESVGLVGEFKMLIPGIIPSLALYVQGLHPQENCLFPSPGFRVGGQGWGATALLPCTHTDVHTQTHA